MSTVDDIKVCAACGEGGDDLKTCTACKMVKYCNATCQKAHRPQHKKECKKRAAELKREKEEEERSPIHAASAAAKVKALEKYCESNELSLDGLHGKIDAVLLNEQGSMAAQRSWFFHNACWNERVTFEIIEALIEAFPRQVFVVLDASDFTEEVDITSQCYPLHLACLNEGCPSSIVELLVKKNPGALSQMCIVQDGINYPYQYDDLGCIAGDPLHYYLNRKSNIEVGMVKMMADGHPDSLRSGDGRICCSPAHTLVCNPNIADLRDIVEYFCELTPCTFEYMDRGGQKPLHYALQNENMTGDIVRLLLDAHPGAIYQLDVFGEAPLHIFCRNSPRKNEEESVAIGDLLIEIDPSLVMEPSQNENGELPIHLAAGRVSTQVCKKLIEAYPESIKLRDSRGMLPIHGACLVASCSDDVDGLDTVEHLSTLYPASIEMVSTGNGYLPLHFAVLGGNFCSRDIHWGPKRRTMEAIYLYTWSVTGLERHYLVCSTSIPRECLPKIMPGVPLLTLLGNRRITKWSSSFMKLRFPSPCRHGQCYDDSR